MTGALGVDDREDQLPGDVQPLALALDQGAHRADLSSGEPRLAPVEARLDELGRPGPFEPRGRRRTQRRR